MSSKLLSNSTKKNAMNELQALQNAANDLGLIITQKMQNDKRFRTPKYFARMGGETISPVIDYDKMNHFLLGWRKRGKLNSKLPDKKANHFEFKTIGQNIYFRPDSECNWMLFSTCFYENDAKLVCKALQFSDINFANTYAYHSDTLSPK